MVGNRGRNSVGKGMIRLDTELVYGLAYKTPGKSIPLLKKNADLLSITNSGDPFPWTESALVCEFSSGLGRRHRPGCAFRRSRTLVPIQIGHSFQLMSDSCRSEATLAQSRWVLGLFSLWSFALSGYLCGAEKVSIQSMVHFLRRTVKNGPWVDHFSKSDPEKLRMALRLGRERTMTTAWIAQQL